MKTKEPAITFNESKHEYKVDGKVYPSVTQVLKDTGLIDASWYAEGGAVRGTLIHELCEMLDTGTPFPAFVFDNEIDDYVLGCLKAYDDFKKIAKPKWKEIELHWFNPTLQCAGTPDRIGVLWPKSKQEEGTILDIKTGQPQEWHHIQMAGYMKITGLNKSTAYLSNILYLKPNGKWRMDSKYCKEYEDLFMAALKIYHWKAAHA